MGRALPKRFSHLVGLAQRYGTRDVLFPDLHDELLERLDESDLKRLAGVHRLLAVDDNAVKLSTWIDAQRPRDDTTRSLIYLMHVLTLLGERRIEPFDDPIVKCESLPKSRRKKIKLPHEFAFVQPMLARFEDVETEDDAHELLESLAEDQMKEFKNVKARLREGDAFERLMKLADPGGKEGSQPLYWMLYATDAIR